jgi:hypothetical protein
MVMPALGARCSALLVPLLIAAAALVIGGNAHARGQCDVALNDDQALQVMSDGEKVPLEFGGCWEPDSAVEGNPAAFSGVNRELLGRIALSFKPGTLNITNSDGDVRSLDLVPVVSGLWPDEIAATHSAAPFAYWEGQTLVVRTIAVKPSRVHIIERISLRDPDTMEYALHVVSVNRDTPPLTIRVLYRREGADNSGSRPCSR